MAFGDSKIGIINIALGFLGNKPVNDLTNEGTSITSFAALYDLVKICCLNEAAWSFATKSVRLSKLATASDFPGYQYIYALPTNPNPLNLTEQRTAVRSILTEQNGEVSKAQPIDDYRITSDLVYTNQDMPTFCIYIFNQIESKYSSSFVQYLALTLATMGCVLITQSEEKQKMLAELLAIARTKAFQDDRIQSPPIIIQRDFAATRYGRGLGPGQPTFNGFI